MKNRLILFLHLHKTAGMTFAANLLENFKPEHTLAVYARQAGLRIQSEAPSQGWEREKIDRYLSGHAGPYARLVYGHSVYWGAHHFFPGKKPFYLTFLRDPVERVVSLYSYHLKTGGFWHQELAQNGWPIEQWLEKSQMLWNRNGQIRQILWHSHPEVLNAAELGENDFKEALSTLEKFDFVGTIESFDQDSDFLYGFLGLGRFHNQAHVNKTPEKIEISESARKLILSRNLLDARLHEWAARRRFLSAKKRSYFFYRQSARLTRKISQARASFQWSRPCVFRGVPSQKSVQRSILENLQRMAQGSEYEKLYLWPRTPLGHDHQAIIKKRVGATDYEIDNKRSRSARIIAQIRRLVEHGLIPREFSMLDIACGDAVILWQIKKCFPKAACHGMDCNKDVFGTHGVAQEAGVRLYKGYIQHLFDVSMRKSPWDVVLMLNTYRGWESADLRAHEKSLPFLADNWFEKNARFVILTATEKQIRHLKSQGFIVQRMGRGEDASVLICVTAGRRLPWGFFRRVGHRFLKSAAKGAVVPRWLVHNARDFGWKDTAFFLRRLVRGLVERKVPLGIFFDADALSGFFGRRWPIHPVLPDTTYVFVFLGEFGYEVFNWQGVVRKFSKLLPVSSDIVVAGRKGLEPFYPSASRYMDISDLPLFRESYAAAYFALDRAQVKRRRPPEKRQLEQDRLLRQAITAHVKNKLARPGRRCEFIFSSSLTAYPGCVFGVDPRFYGLKGAPGSIYANLNLDNNVYRKIEPVLSSRPDIEKMLGFSLDAPYVLIQSRRRAIGPKLGGRVDERLLVEEMARHIPVIYLAFETGRFFDSGSSYAGGPCERIMVYTARSFAEQSCLIAHARRCVFISEGDLGSHTYLPVFMGKDVFVVASSEIFAAKSAPIDFWNEQVFRFGGKMIPLVWETISRSSQDLESAAQTILTQDLEPKEEAVGS